MRTDIKSETQNRVSTSESRQYDPPELNPQPDPALDPSTNRSSKSIPSIFTSRNMLMACNMRSSFRTSATETLRKFKIHGASWNVNDRVNGYVQIISYLRVDSYMDCK